VCCLERNQHVIEVLGGLSNLCSSPFTFAFFIPLLHSKRAFGNVDCSR
jgi:hypothetical protein